MRWKKTINSNNLSLNTVPMVTTSSLGYFMVLMRCAMTNRPKTMWEKIFAQRIRTQGIEG